MNTCLLVEAKMLPVPSTITVIQDFGLETVRDHEGHTTRGYVMYLTGEASAFCDWLRPFAGFWTSSNPMLGDWKIMHVRGAEEQA